MVLAIPKPGYIKLSDSMSTINHQIVVSFLSEKVRVVLKRICQDWTRIGENIYVVHHSNAQKKSCPLCSQKENK